jgi:hypothetical protein
VENTKELEIPRGREKDNRHDQQRADHPKSQQRIPRKVVSEGVKDKGEKYREGRLDSQEIDTLHRDIIKQRRVPHFRVKTVKKVQTAMRRQNIPGRNSAGSLCRRIKKTALYRQITSRHPMKIKDLSLLISPLRVILPWRPISGAFQIPPLMLTKSATSNTRMNSTPCGTAPTYGSIAGNKIIAVVPELLLPTAGDTFYCDQQESYPWHRTCTAEQHP